MYITSATRPLPARKRQMSCNPPVRDGGVSRTEWNLLLSHTSQRFICLHGYITNMRWPDTVVCWFFMAKQDETFLTWQEIMCFHCILCFQIASAQTRGSIKSILRSRSRTQNFTCAAGAILQNSAFSKRRCDSVRFFLTHQKLHGRTVSGMEELKEAFNKCSCSALLTVMWVHGFVNEVPYSFCPFVLFHIFRLRIGEITPSN